MRLLVLAGGFGTRLKSVVSDVPKALAPVVSVPFLQLQIENWVLHGLNQFTFLLHHQADQIIDFLNSKKNSTFKDCQIDWVIEPTPMDTGGAVALAVSFLNLKDDFLVTNADTWLGEGFRELIFSVEPAIAIVRCPDVSRYGQVLLNKNQRVDAFKEKKYQSEEGWINAGLYHLSPLHFNSWNGKPFSLERDLFATLIKNRSLNAVALAAEFIDIGIPFDYHRFCNWIEAGQKTKLCD